MAGSFSIVWARLIHDLGLYEHELTLEEVLRAHSLAGGGETAEEEEERLHTEVGGLSVGPQL